MKFKEFPSRQRGLITKGIRDAFKRSDTYKECMNYARVEKPRYKKDGGLAKVPNVYFTCAECKTLNKQNQVQIDHIEPVIAIYERLEDLSLNDYAERVHNTPVQVLCKACHDIKSKAENKERRLFKKLK